MKIINRSVFLLLIMVSPIFLKAQSDRLVVSKTAQCFINKHTNQFFVFDDSVSYYSISANGKKWAKHHFTFLSTDLNFEEFKNRFKPITFNNGRIVFVYGGVGEVYELINDTLQRIDHSFKHENQHGNALVEYNNKVYAFGGYGLFTFKNILTYFDNSTKEWHLQNTDVKPTPRCSPFYQLHKNELYIFGGSEGYGSKLSKHIDCWRYNFKTNVWKKMGLFNQGYSNIALTSGASNPNIPFDLSISTPDIWVIDCKQNTIDHYKTNSNPYVVDAFFDQTKKHLLLKNKYESNYYILIKPSQSVLKNKIESFPFYIEQTTINWTLILSLLFVLLIFTSSILFFVRRKQVKTNTVATKKQLKLKNNQLFIGERMINNDLTLLEFRILIKFIEHKHVPIDIVSLNELFEDESTSLAAQKKRRETTLKALREKLAFFLNVTHDNVFLESRDSNDKRIKKFVINPDILAD